MIDAFYILLITVFGGLGILTFVTSTIRANMFKEELVKIEENLDRLEAQINEIRTELQANELDLNLFQEEKQALESQKACMAKLEEEYEERLNSEEGEKG